jgi:hypothetical protein
VAASVQKGRVTRYPVIRLAKLALWALQDDHVASAWRPCDNYVCGAVAISAGEKKNKEEAKNRAQLRQYSFNKSLGSKVKNMLHAVYTPLASIPALTSWVYRPLKYLHTFVVSSYIVSSRPSKLGANPVVVNDAHNNTGSVCTTVVTLNTRVSNNL